LSRPHAITIVGGLVHACSFHKHIDKMQTLWPLRSRSFMCFSHIENFSTTKVEAASPLSALSNNRNNIRFLFLFVLILLTAELTSLYRLNVLKYERSAVSL
jgi:hypothetical protein